MPIWKEFYSAKSIEDALLALAGAEAPAKLVAGGTDLFLDLQQGRHAPIQTLIDVTAIPELLRHALTGATTWQKRNETTVDFLVSQFLILYSGLVCILIDYNQRKL